MLLKAVIMLDPQSIHQLLQLFNSETSQIRWHFYEGVLLGEFRLEVRLALLLFESFSFLVLETTGLVLSTWGLC